MNLILLNYLFILQGNCYCPKQVLVWLHSIADAGIALAFYSIAVMLIYFVHKREDIFFPQITRLLFGCLLGYGTVHLLAIGTIWYPIFAWLEEIVNIITTGIFLLAAIAIFLNIPRVLSLPNPQQLITFKQELSKQINQLQRVDSYIHNLNNQLEARVKERTLELKNLNQQLIREINERKQIEATLQHQLRLEQLIIRLSTQFINIAVIQDNTLCKSSHCDAACIRVGINRAVKQSSSLVKLSLAKNGSITTGKQELQKHNYVAVESETKACLDREGYEDFRTINNQDIDFVGIDISIEEGLQTISEFAGIDRAYLFLFSQPHNQISHTYQWSNSQARSDLLVTKEIDLEQNLPWVVNQIKNKQIINLPYVDNLPLEANKDQNYLKQQNIKSLLMLPMFYGGLLVGLLGFSSQEQHKNWTEGDIQLLRLAGEIFINAIERCRQQEQLIVRTQELESSNQELQQFTHIVSHDLQEPLRAISSYVELLEEEYRDSLDAEAHEYIDFILGGTQRMKKLIQDLLVFSRVGRQPQRFSLVYCEEVLTEVVANLKIAIAENEALITWDNLPPVMADKSQLILLWQNLIANSIKFRSQQSPQIHISAVTKDKELIFCLCDNGIGIDPKHAERIFIIFQRLHTRRTYPGTGIGLAICKRIVELHKGRIWVDSSLGEGATFYFSLPTRNQPK